MKTPVRYSRDRLMYTGRLARTPFEAWADSDHGRAVLEPIAETIGFAVLGRTRAARRRVWRQLNDAARSPRVVSVVQNELDSYLTRLDTLVFAKDLPRVGIDLHRLVVVPRVFVNGEAYRRIDAALRAEPAFASLDGGASLRAWFAVMLVDSVAAAVVAAKPSTRSPLPAGTGWVTVGVNDQFSWRIPFDGPAWPGHYFVLELKQQPLTRAVRKAANDAIVRLEATLPSLPRSRRVEIVRQADLSLDRLLARA